MFLRRSRTSGARTSKFLDQYGGYVQDPGVTIVVWAQVSGIRVKEQSLD